MMQNRREIQPIMRPDIKTKNGGAVDTKRRQLIGAIDQGTSSTRFLVFENGTGKLIASSQIEIQRIVPKEGWVEIDPNAIMESVHTTIANVHEQLNTTTLADNNGARSPLRDQSAASSRLKCIGICNQRESTVVWDSRTGKALYNVIVWMDNRTKDLVDKMIDSAPGRDFNWLKDKTGLPMSTYFSAFKLKWLIDNVEEVKLALKERRLLFGTVDSWILWNLTGKHLTDVTNASRTFLMDIETLNWDKTLCKLFNIPINILPKILSSADDFGQVQCGPLKGLPVTGVIGDQSAALFGQNCLQMFQTKATFGTGCFIMQNVGPGPLNGALAGVHRDAKRGLITTVGYKLRDRPACYALEGSVKIAGAAITWLRDNMQLIKDYEECDQLINKTTNSAGVFFVPALGGLYSPYWDPNASGLFIGLSQFTRREHLVRATFDAVAYQTNDILRLMPRITNGLVIDGGLCKSDNMCQILADITGCEIVRPSMCEASALGAAMVAGCGAGIWSYETMLASSNTAYEYSSSSNQNRHYPHETLHYEEKFSSIIHSMNGTTNGLTNRTSAANLDAGGGGVNDDAGGGQLQIVLSDRQLTSGGNDDRNTTISNQLVGSDTKHEYETTGAEVTAAPPTAANTNINATTSRSSSNSGSGNEEICNNHDELNHTITIPEMTNNQFRSIDENLVDFDPTPSSGYNSSSNDNFEINTTNSAGSCADQLRRGDSPVSSVQVTTNTSESPTAEQMLNTGNDADCDQRLSVAKLMRLDLSEDNESMKEQHGSSSITHTFPSNLASCLRHYICPSDDGDCLDQNLDDLGQDGDDDDSYSDDYDSDGRYADEQAQCEAGRLAGSMNRIVTRPVDVFQSYISLEHRTELVDTWSRAVERSMQWTKTHHEEVRRIDYQRLSSLPISMYLFFSIGLVALSGLCSGRGFMVKY